MPHEYDPKTLGYLADHLQGRTFSQESQRILDLLKPYGKPAWLPVTEDGEGDPQGSRYFGRPWLLESEEWPTVQFPPRIWDPNPEPEMLVFVLQINLETLPLEAQKILGSTGLFQFFYDGDGGDAYLARVISLDQPGGLRDVPDEQLNTNLYQKPKGSPLTFTPKFILKWAFREDFPRKEEFYQLEPSFNEELYEMSNLSKGQGFPFFGRSYAFACDKIGGWPLWVQGVDYPLDFKGEPMQLIFSLNETDHGSNDIVGANGHLFKSKTLNEFKFLIDGT